MTVTLIETIEQLEKVVELKGHDYIYDQRDRWGACSNFRDGLPSCLVGHVWYNLGFGPDWFAEHDLSEKASADAVHRYLDIEPAAWVVLTIAQHLQDLDCPWGPAVRIAVELGSGVTSFEEAESATNFVIPQVKYLVEIWSRSLDTRRSA